MELSGLLLMFILGMRHGIDPDHIAIIDGISVRYAQTKPRLAKWTGTLFATGHGAVVTIIMIMVSQFSHSWHFPASVWWILDFLPGLLLILVGILNLQMLLSKKKFQPTGIKTFFIPAKLKQSSHPLAILLTGVLFAMVFDTNTQAAAWAYTAASDSSAFKALALGFSFSAEMVITDSIDSRILYALITRPAGNDTILNYRRKLGWIIVYLSLIVGSYKMLALIFPAIEPGQTVLTISGIAFFVMMVFFYGFILYSMTKRPNTTVYGDQRPYKD